METKKLIFLITGLTLIIFLSVFSTLSTFGKADILCSFAGPDLSNDLLRLTDFVVTGPSLLKEGDTITVKFNLQNFGQSDLNLGSKGIFAKAQDPDNIDASFGFSYQNTTLKVGQTLSLQVSKSLNKAGTWVIWPSYHLSLATGEKLGPDNWHACSLTVGAKIIDFDEDGISDQQDNCPHDYNPKQEDIDKDGIGDVCDPCDDRDSDNDGIKNCLDACPDKPETFNNYQDDDGCPDEVPEIPEEDKTPPTVEVTASPTSPHPDDKITFTAKARDLSGIKGITIFVNNIAKRQCFSLCEPKDKLAGRCFDLKFSKGEYVCIFTSDPYSVGTLTYKAEALDNKNNKGESGEEQIDVRIEIEMPPPRLVGCFYSISGEVRRRYGSFPYDFATLKIKSCRVVPSEGMTLVMCTIGTTRYTDVSAENGRYTIDRLCPDTTYLIEPVYQAAEGRGKCRWRGSWEPESNIVTIENSSVSYQNFTFTPIEEVTPFVRATYTPEVSRPGGEVSTGDMITFQVNARDRDHGIAKIQILLRLDPTGRDDYGEQEIVRECNFSTFPREPTCTFIGGPWQRAPLRAKRIEIEGVACDKNGNLNWNREYVSLTEAHCLNGSRDADEQDIDCGGADCEPCPRTCDDGIQNRGEEGIDCGGRYCPPCSQCETGAKWAPHDTPCRHHWPTDEGPNIGMNTSDDSCAIAEVCHPELDYIVEDAITCCEHSDFERRFSGHRAENKRHACGYARGTSGINIDYNPVTFKKCLGVYAISGFGGATVYMQGYFDGEWSCYGDRTATSCPKWRVAPPAWEMGTAASCAGAGGARPDFQMGGHRCVYTDWGAFNRGRKGYWNSDTDWRSNNDSACDVPAHASINRLSTGTCVDYSFALTTLLRKMGYSKDEVFSVNGEGHGYNLVKFPGETKWNYVDTVGNRGGEIFGGIGHSQIYNSAGTLVAWYDYCKNMDGGCSNDSYGESRGRCPSNNEIYTCEGISR